MNLPSWLSGLLGRPPPRAPTTSLSRLLITAKSIPPAAPASAADPGPSLAQQETPMSFNLTKLFNTAVVVVEDAEYILTRVQFYMSLVDSSALSGAQKLAAVKSALEADLTTAKPSLVPAFDQLWAAVAPAVSGMVTIFRLTGELAPIVKAAEAVAAVA